MKTFGRVCAFALILSSAVGQQTWWPTTDGQATTDDEDFAAVNQGQVKNMALHAKNHLDGVYGTSSPAIEAMINGWLGNTANAQDFSAANLGMLKSVSKPFWDVLISKNVATAYPWTTATSDDQDFAAANIGQLKTVFNFKAVIIDTTDSDGDGIPDYLELANGLDPNNPWDALGDLDGDGLSNATELATGSNTDPNNSDTNGDGIPDGQVFSSGDDPDLDSFPVDTELNTHQTNPLSLDTDTDGLPDWFEIDSANLDPLDGSDAGNYLNGNLLTIFEDYFQSGESCPLSTDLTIY